MPDKTIDIRKSDIMRFAKEGQLCWHCRKACGGCSWSHDLTPVEGWTAERADLNMWNYGNGMSYRVYACPEYEEDTP